MKVGFIGLGIMGSRMAMNLLHSGHELVVYNRTQSKADPLVSAGAKRAETPAQAAQGVEVLFTMLAEPEAVREVAEGSDGFLSQLGPAILWVDSSTVNPSFSKKMAETVRTQGGRFMDAPVAGTKSPAEKGDLVFLVGGNQEDLDEIRPLLDVMGKQVIHAGPVGSGTALKMLFNLLLGVGMAAFSEALLLGEGLGLKRDFLLDTLIGSAVAPPFLAGKRSKIEAGDYTADFPLQWMQKDLHLAALSGFEQDVSLPATNVVKEIYMLAKKAGLAGQDFAALYEYLKK